MNDTDHTQQILCLCLLELISELDDSSLECHHVLASEGGSQGERERESKGGMERERGRDGEKTKSEMRPQLHIRCLYIHAPIHFKCIKIYI